MGSGRATVQVIAQVAPPGFWGAGEPGDSVYDFGQDVGRLEAEPDGRAHDLVSGVDGQATGNVGQCGAAGWVE
jgi:hypothetical protein